VTKLVTPKLYVVARAQTSAKKNTKDKNIQWNKNKAEKRLKRLTLLLL
jgi:hypothetical protein